MGRRVAQGREDRPSVVEACSVLAARLDFSESRFYGYREGAKLARKRFSHLHVHSDYSLLDGAGKVSDIVSMVAELGQSGVGLTDHGTLGGWVQLLQNARKHEITPVPGLEAYHVQDLSVEKSDRGSKHRAHMLLLAVSNKGYRNLLQLSSIAATENLEGKFPLVDDVLLDRFSEGLVATSGCISSVINQLILQGEMDKAERELLRYQEMFGKGNYFIELQPHDFPDQHRATEGLMELHRRTEIPLLATNDSHYVHQKDHYMHDGMLCVQTGSRMSDEDRFQFSSDQHHIRSTEEMYELFPEDEFPGACSNTELIVERAGDIDITIGGDERFLIPLFPDAKDEKQADEILRERSINGCIERIGDSGRYSKEAGERLDYELNVISSMGFSSYYLIVADIVNWAKKNDIMVGPGRGSGAGSLVAYAMRITDIDPLHHGLYFERFLNPGRRSMPDFDIDIEDAERWRVQQYVVDRYGDDRVSLIGTYGVLRGKSALKAAARVLGHPVSTGVELAALFPLRTANGEITLQDVLGKREDVDSAYQPSWDEGTELRKRVKGRNTGQREIIDLAAQISGLFQNRSKHAGGLLLAPTKLIDHFPIYGPAEHGIYTSAFDGDEIEQLGGLKMDLLGVRNLTTIRRALENIEADHGRRIDILNVPTDDPKVYDLLTRADVDGVFQVNQHGFRRFLPLLQPERFEEIAAALALYRPGPMGTDMHRDFADRKNGRKKIKVDHEDLREMFSETYGLMIYQEQLLELAQHYAGFSAAEADTLRKATGKKDAKLIEGQEQKFKRGVLSNGYSEAVANKLWDRIPPFASYSFNKSHAVAYGMVTYWTAWLKANYPAQFLAACIDSYSGDPIKLSHFISQAKSRSIAVYPPDINRSGQHAVTKDDDIYLSLVGITQAGPSTINPALQERKRGGQYSSIRDYLKRMVDAGVTVKEMSTANLVHAGAFDSLHSSRKGMIEALPDLIDAARSIGGSHTDTDEDDLFGDDTLEVQDALESVLLDEEEDYPLSQKIENEVAALGFFAGEHPFSILRNHLRNGDSELIPPRSLPVGDDRIQVGRGRITAYGVVSSVSRRKARSGREITNVVLESDAGDSLSVVAFMDTRSMGIEPGSILIATGEVQEDVGSAAEDDTLEIRASSLHALPIGLFLEGSGGETYEVLIDEQRHLSNLSRLLSEMGPGHSRVVVIMDGEEVLLPNLFNVTPENVSRIRNLKLEVRLAS